MASEKDRITPGRVLVIGPYTLVTAIALLLLGACVYYAWEVITWLLIAIFLAVSLNPAVSFFERRGLGRGSATGIVFGVAAAIGVAAAMLILPPVINQMSDLISNAPNLLKELSHGHGPLGFLEKRYHIVEWAKTHIDAAKGTESAFLVAKGVVMRVVAAVTIGFMTFFLLLEGHVWKERIIGLTPEHWHPRLRRAASDVSSMIVAYATGNLLVSLIAALMTGILLAALHAPYALPLCLLVAIFDFVPLAGAIVSGVLVSAVAFTVGTASGIIAICVFVVYHQIESHLLRPLIYSRTVKLSPLAVLVAVTVGAALFGLLGALAAIPAAASLQIIGTEIAALRREGQPDDGAVLPDEQQA